MKICKTQAKYPLAIQFLQFILQDTNVMALIQISQLHHINSQLKSNLYVNILISQQNIHAMIYCISVLYNSSCVCQQLNKNIDTNNQHFPLPRSPCL